MILYQGGSGNLFSALLAITTPKQYQMIQRDASDEADILITGTHSGIESGGIEASFNGGAYVTIATGSSGNFWWHVYRNAHRSGDGPRNADGSLHRFT